MIYIGQDFFNSVENLALYLFSYSFVSFALSFIFFFDQCRALYRRMKQAEKTKQELAKNLKTATSKVSQLEVS